MVQRVHGNRFHIRPPLGLLEPEQRSNDLVGDRVEGEAEADPTCQNGCVLVDRRKGCVLVDRRRVAGARDRRQGQVTALYDRLLARVRDGVGSGQGQSDALGAGPFEVGQFGWQPLLLSPAIGMAVMSSPAINPPATAPARRAGLL
jgi:hypothetical protein